MNAQLTSGIVDPSKDVTELPIWLPHGKNKAPQYIDALGVFVGMDWDKSEHWMTYDHAQAIVEANPGLLTGVGIVINKNTIIDGQRLVAIDVDLIDGYRKADPKKGITAVVFDPVADADKVRHIVPLICQIESYWEASPSCTGVHVLALASEAWAAKFGNTGKFYPGGCDHAEFYTGEAPTYITVTGARLGSCNTIGVLSDAVEAYLAPLLTPAGGKSTPVLDISSDGTAFDLEHLSCFTAKHRQMLKGEIPKGMRSEVVRSLLMAFIDAPTRYPLEDIKASVLANAALLNYFGKHANAVEFADSEIAGAYEISTRGRLEKLVSESGKTHMDKSKKPVGVAPLQAKHLITDQANAVRLQTAVGGSVIHAGGKWYVWNGRHWQENEPAAFRVTCTLSSMIDAEATDWENKPYTSNEERDRNKAIADALRKWSTKSEMLDRLNAAFNLLRRLVSVPADNLDCDPYALNVANGTVDLRTGILRPHTRDDLITRCIAIDYDPKARAPLFEKTLAEITNESDMTRKPLAEFLQRWFGYNANGVTTEQKLAVHHGDGANGKSLLFDTVGDTLGAYAGTAAPNLLMAGGQNRHPAEVADLFGMRMVVAHESGEGGALNEDRIKHATGNDRMKARHMRQDFFEFSPTHTLNLLTNHKPTVRGQDMGIWRRVMLIPYSVTFGTVAEVEQGLAQHVRDDRLGEALKAEATGILTWIVRGAVTWFQTGLRPPDAVLIASAEYRIEQDRVGQFLTERSGQYTVLWGDWVPCDPVFKDYQAWCKESGYTYLGKINFIAAVVKRPGIKKEVKRIDWAGGVKAQCNCFSGLTPARVKV